MDNATQLRHERPLSPCILVCTLDDQKRCVGCGRSLEQIRQWSSMTRAEQWAVIDELDARDAGNSVTISADSGD